MEFHATSEEVLAGRVCDVYFRRTVEILKARGLRKRVVAEVTAKSLPESWPWALLVGIEECAEVLSGLPVLSRSLPEGSVFYPWEPVLTIEGCYEEFAEYETTLLGLLCQASGVATCASRCRKAADGRSVLSFGARRAHPMVAPMVERAAYVAGCDGVSTVLAAEKLGIPPSGTMPHSLALVMGSTVEAARAFDEVIDQDVPRIALVDTFGDEKFEAVAAAEALGGRLAGVRLDTPGSRRGDLRRIAEEVRWELDLRGFQEVKIFVSGGINEYKILELNDFADGYGVGTRISAAPTVDFAMDIVEVDGLPVAKRGMASGRKALLGCRSCRARLVAPAALAPAKCHCGGALESLVKPLTGDGKRTGDPPTIARIRERAISQAAELSLEP